MSSSTKVATAAVSTGTGTAWSDPTNIYAVDDYEAITEDTSSSQKLVAYNFGFSIPSDQQIDGIKCYLVGRVSNLDGAYLNLILGDYSTSFTSRGNTNNPLADIPSFRNGDIFVGGATDKWGFTPTYSIVNATTFGVGIWLSTDTGSRTMYIDYVEMTIYYSTSSSTSIKVVNGLAKASVKVVNGLAIASVKGIDGLA